LVGPYHGCHLSGETMKRLGLIVNPVAGIGGRVGLQGSDGSEIQQKALSLGAKPGSAARATQALEALVPLAGQFELFTAPGEMGAQVAKLCGFIPHVLGKPTDSTTAEDTIRVARQMLSLPVDALLFAGGDGTARDIFTAVGTRLPVLGIPAGVKIHSAVFATHPRVAGELAADFLQDRRIRLQEAEVVDLDEEAYRHGLVDARLYGFLKVLYAANHLQGKKVPTPTSEPVRMEAIAAEVVASMQPGWYYIIGPGTTTRAITDRLGFPKTLVGVDVYTLDHPVALDVRESQLLELVENQPAKIIVTPIGGQGFIFGRGNQQIGPRVIQKVGPKNLIVVSLSEKLNALMGKPLLVDTGDPAVDSILAGYLPVIVGYHQKVIYRVAP